MKAKQLVLCLWVAITATLSAVGQTHYPKDYFRNPLDIPIYLAGNFGEFRPNHFHSGLDIKTNQKENLPVYAAAEGYVSRISISHAGYGNCLYIAHPNGYTTVYAHLNTFNPAIQAYLQQQQQLQEKWNVNITLDTPLLAVKKGELVAYSGNTGGSVAPHLHFEIRDTKTERLINAMHFNFAIEDTKAPIVHAVGLYDGSKSVYMQVPKTFKFAPQPSAIDTIVMGWHKIKLGVIADDIINNSTNILGVYKVTMKVDGVVKYATQMDELEFATNACVNGLNDYKYKKLDNKWMQILSKSYNLPLLIFPFEHPEDESITLGHQPKHIEISLSDFQGNTTTIQFYLKQENAPVKSTTTEQWIWANKGGVIENQYFFLPLTKKSLYDHIATTFEMYNAPNALGMYINIQGNYIPLAQPTILSIKVLQPIPFELRNKLVFMHQTKAQSLPGAQASNAVKAYFEQGYAKAKIRNLGSYYMAYDTVAPVIREITPAVARKSAQALQLEITDALTGVKSANAYLDGQWIMLSRRKNIFNYNDDQKLLAKGALLRIEATDESDNMQVLELQL